MSTADDAPAEDAPAEADACVDDPDYLVVINKKGDTRTCAAFLNSPRPAVNRNRCKRENDDGTQVKDFCRKTCQNCGRRRRRRLTDESAAAAQDFVDMEGRYLQEGGDGTPSSQVTAPRSVISLERCAFENNEGESTIHVTAFAENESISRDPGRLGVPAPAPSAPPPPPAPVFAPPAPSPPRVHSIHVEIVETSFVSQRVDTSLIVSDGARLESTQVVFEDNAAESIIRSESEGTVAMSSTAFKENETTGKEQALVVLEDDSDLDVGGGALSTNCVGGQAAPALAASVRCAGISTGGGGCQVLGDDCSAVSAVASAVVEEEQSEDEDQMSEDEEDQMSGDEEDQMSGDEEDQMSGDEEEQVSGDGEEQMASSSDPPPEPEEDGDAASEDEDPPMEPEDDFLGDDMFDEMDSSVGVDSSDAAGSGSSDAASADSSDAASADSSDAAGADSSDAVGTDSSDVVTAADDNSSSADDSSSSSLLDDADGKDINPTDSTALEDLEGSLASSLEGTNLTLLDNSTITLNPTEWTGEDDPPESACFDDWSDLSAAIASNTEDRLFVICAGGTLLATSPIVIDRYGVTVQCGHGNSDSSGKDCSVNGGISHFHIAGSAKGVVLKGIVFASSTGVSVAALGGQSATVELVDCTWTMNGGASAVLIYSGDGFDPEMNKVDIDALRSSSSGGGKAMSVTVRGCDFRENQDLDYGAVVNVGGKLTVFGSKFASNSGEAGDVVVTNGGTVHLMDSCFDASSSMTPGTVFIEKGSSLNSNDNNFGFGNTAGSYGADKSCHSIFQESEISNCLGGEGDDGATTDAVECDGSCVDFESAVCVIDAVSETAPPSDADEKPSTGREGIVIPAYNPKDSEAPKNMIPIIVACLVVAFVVFGFIGIIVRRRKLANKKSGGSQGEVHTFRGSGSAEGDEGEFNVVDKGGRKRRFGFPRRKKKTDNDDLVPLDADGDGLGGPDGNPFGDEEENADYGDQGGGVNVGVSNVVNPFAD